MNREQKKQAIHTFKDLQTSGERRMLDGHEINKEMHDFLEKTPAPTLRSEYDRLIAKPFGLDRLKELFMPKRK